MESSLNKLIGSRIRDQRRTISKYTQEKLADLMGVNRSVIAKLESGAQNISIQQIYQIGSILKVNPKIFLPDLSEEGTLQFEITSDGDLGVVNSSSALSLDELEEIKKTIFKVKDD